MNAPSVRTRSQIFAERAFARVAEVSKRDPKTQADYARSAKRLPALLHTAGLAQAVAFLQAKNLSQLLKDVVFVMNDDCLQSETFAQLVRSAELLEYLRLSRLALEAAGWLKRYAESLLKDTDSGDEQP
jgi:CRISPR-associated protein Cmr5